MRDEVRAYLEDAVIPLIARSYPELLSEASIRVEGSAGLGMNDELSDLEVTVYLPDQVWKERGGQLQLALIHSLSRFSLYSLPHCEFPGDPDSWHLYGHPEINVHPRGELLCGAAEAFLTGTGDIPWAKIGMEELFALQHCPIIRDAGRTLEHIREATAPSCFPQQEWAKRLIHELLSLKGETWDLEKAVRRSRPLEAQMILGTMLPALLHVAFLVNRQYYPWRKYLLPYLTELPGAGAEVLAEFTALGSGEHWEAKLAAANSIVRILTRQILDSGMLTADMLEYLFDARNGQAWANPHWRELPDHRRSKAKEAGYDWLDGWIWGWWGWD
jgi:hypothetical protein